MSVVSHPTQPDPDASESSQDISPPEPLPGDTLGNFVAELTANLRRLAE